VPAAGSAGTRAVPKTPASSRPSADRFQNAAPLPAGADLVMGTEGGFAPRWCVGAWHHPTFRVGIPYDRLDLPSAGQELLHGLRFRLGHGRQCRGLGHGFDHLFYNKIGQTIRFSPNAILLGAIFDVEKIGHRLRQTGMIWREGLEGRRCFLPMLLASRYPRLLAADKPRERQQKPARQKPGTALV
jgi:hypothetical protein